jgi:uracil phosphoribosyltransferase
MRLLVEDALASLPALHEPVTVRTPCGTWEGVERRRRHDDQCSSMTAVSIVRSGDCLVEAIREIEPAIRVGKILLQRDEAAPNKRPVYVQPHVQQQHTHARTHTASGR